MAASEAQRPPQLPRLPNQEPVALKPQLLCHDLACSQLSFHLQDTTYASLKRVDLSILAQQRGARDQQLA